jgi:hypothetical protein
MQINKKKTLIEITERETRKKMTNEYSQDI